MSRSGVTEPRHAAARDADSARPAAADTAPLTRAEPVRGGAFYIPDFCEPRMVFATVLISALVALTLTLARPTALPFLTELARVSVFVVWVGLTSAALLCYGRRFIERLSFGAAAGAVFGMLLANTLALSAATVWLGRRLDAEGMRTALFPEAYGGFMLRTGGICLIVVAMLLRYFFVSHQWRHHVRAEARSRINALQARIRPHFLFNGLNTIASLTRTDPGRAEAAVEDLADLFRVTLRDSERPLTLGEELDLTRIYERIETLRLGDRLRVAWEVADLPKDVQVPGLIIQPLLENAIYHGIENLDAGGEVRISGRAEGGLISISVANPYRAGPSGSARAGNRVALENIRERLRLAYGERGRLDVSQRDGRFEVTLRFPRAP